VPGIIVLGPGGMQFLIALLIVGLLKENVGPDSCVLQLSVILNGGGGNIHIDSPDGAVLMMDSVNSLDAFQNILDGIVDRILSSFQSKALMSHILKGDYFLSDLFLCQFFSGDMPVFQMIRQ
jgi:hypothetical protein